MSELSNLIKERIEVTRNAERAIAGLEFMKELEHWSRGELSNKELRQRVSCQKSNTSSTPQ